jgi:hypothetical protein
MLSVPKRRNFLNTLWANEIYRVIIHDRHTVNPNLRLAPISQTPRSTTAATGPDATLGPLMNSVAST